MKHALKLLVCAAMLCLCFVFAAPRASAADVVASGTCGAEGDNLTWTVDSEGTLTISGEGAMADYSYDSSPWYNFRNHITRLSLDNNITSIGAYAFCNCDAIIDISELPVRLSHIADWAFYDCLALRTITFPVGVREIGQGAFLGCQNLTAIKLPEGILSIGDSIFTGCTSLQEISFPSSITSIGTYAFSGCISLSQISVAKNNLIFCSEENILYSKDFSTLLRCSVQKQGSFAVKESVTKIAPCAFDGCAYLTKVKLPLGLKTLGEAAFARCDSLKTCTIPEGIQNLEFETFLACTSLTGIVLPQTLEVIDATAFEGCTSLKEISIPSSVSIINGIHALKGCSSLSSITVAAENDTYYSAGGLLYQKTNSTLIKCPEGISTDIAVSSSITSIGSMAFYGCDSLAAVYLPKSILSIGTRAFSQCSNLPALFFEGDAPTIADSAFSRTAATAYYPADNETWTEDVLQDYGGDITWVPYTEDTVYHTRFSLEDIPNNEFDLDITVTRLKDSADDVAMIALYSPEGQFLEMTTHALTDDTVQTISFTRNNADGGIGSVQVFILDSLVSPIPLAPAAGI